MEEEKDKGKKFTKDLAKLELLNKSMLMSIEVLNADNIVTIPADITKCETKKTEKGRNIERVTKHNEVTSNKLPHTKRKPVIEPDTTKPKILIVTNHHGINLAASQDLCTNLFVIEAMIKPGATDT
ncbi:hypothetical protein JTB14_007161 [Gonioctena quinquepunctata]|nr:hypothetical protein JTB14_007161 [Gonioctena quinquepunctata]